MAQEAILEKVNGEVHIRSLLTSCVPSFVMVGIV